jgi:hypothetical protein
MQHGPQPACHLLQQLCSAGPMPLEPALSDWALGASHSTLSSNTLALSYRSDKGIIGKGRSSPLIWHIMHYSSFTSDRGSSRVLTCIDSRGCCGSNPDSLKVGPSPIHHITPWHWAVVAFGYSRDEDITEKGRSSPLIWHIMHHSSFTTEVAAVAWIGRAEARVNGGSSRDSLKVGPSPIKHIAPWPCAIAMIKTPLDRQDNVFSFNLVYHP